METLNACTECPWTKKRSAAMDDVLISRACCLRIEAEID